MGRTEESEMRKTLLATVAVATVVGFGGIAQAQSQMGDESKKGTPGAMQEQKGGSMSGTRSREKTLTPTPSAQGMEKQGTGKQNERLGQGREEQKGMTRGAQEEKRGVQQKGAQEERGLQQKGTQKGAQEERGTQLKGAQEQRGMQERGVQQQTGKSGVTTTERTGQSGTSRGTSVQLSQDQRSQIKTIIGKEHAPRVSGNVNFDVTVGAKIPRSVHVEVLPEEIILIVPEYRGFDYVLVGDYILIIDPLTLEIVAVIPA
jgi:hypothetical protein